MKPLIPLVAAFAFACFAGPAVAGQPQAPLSVEQAFEQLRAYDYGQNRRPLAMLELEIARSTADPKQGRKMAERLAAVLTDAKATLAAKRFVCQWLPLVASDAQVPVLAKMLDTAETADMARRAIEAIPGEASAGALRQALGRLKGDALVGVVNSLGARRHARATAMLAELLRAPDKAVAAAAATALGQIGGQEAMAALEKAEDGADAALLDALRDAQLRAAASGGAGPAIFRLYKRLGHETMPVRWRLAAMSGAMRTCGQAAWSMIRQALASDDGVLRGAAANLLRQTPPRIPTSVLARELKEGDLKVRALLIDVLGERADPAAKDAVAAFIDAKDETLRVAAVHAISRMGGADEVEPLLRLASTERGPVQQAARVGLERLTGDGVESRFLAAAGRGSAAVRTEAVATIAARRTAGATDVLVGAAGDKDASLRRAALDALAVVGEPAAYPKLIELMMGPSTKEVWEAMLHAVLAIGKRIADPEKRVRPVVEALPRSVDPVKVGLLRVLAGFGGSEALDAVRRSLKGEQARVRDAAVRALASWPDASAAADLLNVAKDSDSATHRSLTLRGYLRLARAAKDKAARLRMLQQVRPVATTAEAKKMLLAALADVRGPDALQMAKSFLDDPQARAEAELAVRKITDAKKPKRAGGAAVPAYNPQRSDALKTELAKHAPKGCRLACYLDCGPDTADGAKSGPTLRQTSGRVHFWPGSERQAHSRFGTVAFDEQQAVFEATGLNPKRSYQIAFTWWDYDHDTRAQSVWVAGKAGPFARLLGKTKLPAGQARSEKPAEKTLPIPRTLSAGGTVRIAFRNEASPNAVVSELWLWESEVQSPPPDAAGGKPQPNSKPPMPQVKVSAKAGDANTRILIVTGIDYPGHKWRETTPVLTEAIEKDTRLAVDVVEDPNFLASPAIHEYAAIVHHWMNWKTPAPGPAARENFRKFVSGGGGLVVVHFGCGAFQDWPEFVKIAGRVWDPKLRGHDPRGPFRVEIADSDHPVTRGMKPFDTYDELYTCLAGEVPIDVLATARSKVDKKVYPIAFVLTCGKGRVFHSVLGHDVKALASPPVGELFRRASAWAAGLPPVAKSK
jgi:type 1 glutamine amidotransferase/HEAT repeat protein